MCFAASRLPVNMWMTFAITTQVKYELLESKKVDGLDVNVDVMNGKVKLTGWASSDAERSKASETCPRREGREVRG